jgi:hypothetical protein
MLPSGSNKGACVRNEREKARLVQCGRGDRRKWLSSVRDSPITNDRTFTTNARSGTASPSATLLTVPRQRSPLFVRSVTTLARTRQEYLPACCPEVLGTRRRPTLTLRCRVSCGRTPNSVSQDPSSLISKAHRCPCSVAARRYRIGGRLPEAGTRGRGIRQLRAVRHQPRHRGSALSAFGRYLGYEPDRALDPKGSSLEERYARSHGQLKRRVIVATVVAGFAGILIGIGTGSVGKTLLMVLICVAGIGLGGLAVVKVSGPPPNVDH